MPTSSRPRHGRRPRLCKIPMMPPLHGEFALTLHLALANLRTNPSADHFEAIARIFNVISLTIENDTRFVAEARVLEGGARAMNQIAPGFEGSRSIWPTEIELMPVQNAVNVCDRILPRLDVTRLHVASERLRAWKILR